MIARYKPYIVFLSFIAVGLGAFFLVSAGYYPILVVNNRIVSARTFWKDYQAASRYYQNIVKTYSQAISQENVLTSTDIQLSVLEQLIENNLVSKEVERQIGEDLSSLVKTKVDKFSEDKKLHEAVAQLYGFSFGDFQEEILIPQAEREILAGRLFLKGEKLDGWLVQAKKSARVILFSPKFHWNGEKLENVK